MDAPQLLSLPISSDNFQENERKADLNVSPARRSIRKNVLARGLARRYDDQKGRKEILKSRILRQKKQLAILEEYNRRKEAEGAKQDQVKKLQSSKTSPSRGIVPQKGLTNFPRNTSLRVLADNQAEERGDEDGDHFDEDLNSPTEEDLKLFAALTSKTDPSDIARVLSSNKIPGSQQSMRGSGSGSASKENGERSNGSSSIDKSSAQVLCELRATKEIVIREQTLKQLHQLVPAINTLAEEISAIIQKKAAAAAILTTTAFSRLHDKRASSSLTVAPLSTRRLESGQAKVAVAERDTKELSTQLAELSDKLKHRVKQFQTLIGILQEASMNAAEAIIEWRHFRTRRYRFTNFQPLYRFPWKKMRVLNYLTHMDTDLHFLFQTAMLRVVVGPDVTYNPLLLSRDQLASLGFVESNLVSTTFLTERRSDDETTTSTNPGSSSSPRASAVAPIPPHKLVEHYEALLAAMKSENGNMIQPLVVNGGRARRCLEILQQEKELEAAEAKKVESEKQRMADAYNPFASIKAIGGVEETLTQLLTAQSPHLAALSQQLRHRQEDTTRAADGPVQTAPDHEQAPPLKVPREPSEQLRVNSRRLRRILEKRKEQTVSTTECEMRSVQTWGTKNKLPGQLVVRKMTVKRQQNQYARRIQLQFRVHRLRRNILQNLTLFIAETRQSAVHIQRIFRGYCAKKDYNIIKMLLEAERQRHEAVRKIWHAYRRYKRRLRHRRSMTVESIAQAQLFNIQYQKLQEEGEDAVDRYRRVGEERRRQRVVLLQKRRLEQLELEQKRSASAIKIQAVVRGHLAKCELSNLWKEKKSHLTAVCIMTLQSNVRRFLKRQEARRLRFRQDLERVNRSAVRIQSIYRGYNSRASLLVQLDETMKDSLGHASQRRHNDMRDDDLDEQEGEEDEGDDDTDRLPPLRLPRPSSSCDNEGSTHEGLHAIIAMLSSPSSSSKASSDHNATRLTLPPLRSSVVVVPNTPTNRRLSFTRQPSAPHSVQSMTRVELKLKEPLIGDDFERGGGSMSARRDSCEAKRSRGGRIS